jgi:C1A family cysteine protease
LAYVKDHGITDTNSYPYTAKTQNCKATGGNFKISSVPTARGCTALLEALNGRPVGVSVDATNWSPYKSGIFNNCKANLDHDVLLVGATDSYWKIKNSWSTSWG